MVSQKPREAIKDPLDKRWHGVGVGGSVALDFANTLDWRLRKHPSELVSSYIELLRWARWSGAIDPATARGLRGWSLSHSREGLRLREQALEIREAIAELLHAVVDGKVPSTAALLRFEEIVRDAFAARTLKFKDGEAMWEWRERSPEPLRPAWAAALDAERLLTSPDRERIRQCADAECGWFFLDTTRNQSRRWCSMKACGNRNKARRFYRRKKH
jgi:predicted RNA-binding Zn ribbon-like protein